MATAPATRRPEPLRDRLGRERVSVDWRSRGDVADDLGERLIERAAIMELESGHTPEDAARMAWARLRIL